jgi:hypothetical protein
MRGVEGRKSDRGEDVRRGIRGGIEGRKRVEGWRRESKRGEDGRERRLWDSWNGKLRGELSKTSNYLTSILGKKASYFSLDISITVQESSVINTWWVHILDLSASSDCPRHGGRGSTPGQGSVISVRAASEGEGGSTIWLTWCVVKMVCGEYRVWWIWSSEEQNGRREGFEERRLWISLKE